jgi:hypothetical protein
MWKIIFVLTVIVASEVAYLRLGTAPKREWNWLARSNDDWGYYGEYLANWPQGKHAEEALRELLSQPVQQVSADSRCGLAERGLERYSQTHPNSTESTTQLLLLRASRELQGNDLGGLAATIDRLKTIVPAPRHVVYERALAKLDDHSYGLAVEKAEAGDLEQLEAYLLRVPRGRNAEQAESLLEDRRFELARDGSKTDTAALLAYIKWTLVSRHTAKAKLLVDDRTYASAAQKVIQGESTDLRAYIEQFPEGAHLDDAKKLLADLELSDATRKAKSGDLSALHAYAERAAPDDRRSDALALLDDESFRLLSSDAPGLAKYLVQFPNGRHTDEANQLIDDRAFAAVSDPTKRDVSGLQGYLGKFPAGRHVQEANRLMDDQAYGALVEKARAGNIDSLRAYLKDSAGATRLDEAKLLLTQLDEYWFTWAKNSRSDRTAELIAYLEKFPDGKYVREAAKLASERLAAAAAANAPVVDPKAYLDPRHLLMEGAAMGDLSAIRIALALGIDVNTGDDEGNPALIRALGFDDRGRIEAGLRSMAQSALKKGVPTAASICDISSGTENAVIVRVGDYYHRATPSQHEIINPAEAAKLPARLLEAMSLKVKHPAVQIVDSAHGIGKASYDDMLQHVRAAVAYDDVPVDKHSEIFTLTDLRLTKYFHGEEFDLPAFLADDFLARQIREGRTITGVAHSPPADVFKFLIDRGADVNRRSSDDRSALLRAAEKGDLAIVTLLLDKGAHVNARSAAGETPLCAAAEYGHQDVLKYLLDHGADADRRTNDGKSALDFARAAENTAIVQLLAPVTH